MGKNVRLQIISIIRYAVFIFKKATKNKMKAEWENLTFRGNHLKNW